MINKLSLKLTQLLISKNQIIQDDFELYHYGIFVIISEIFLLSIVVVLGLLLGVFLPSLLFFFTFHVLHRFAGGFHAKTELHCQILTISFFLLALIFLKNSIKINDVVISGILFASSLLLVFLTPADTPNKVLSKIDKNKFRRFTICTVLIFSIIVLIINKLFGKNLYSNSIVIAIVLETISVFFGKLLNYRI